MTRIFILLVFISSTFTSMAQEIKAMTYNIRLDYSGDGQNTWDERKAHLVNQLLFHEPDVLGIQEGLPHQVAYLDERLDEYAYVGVGREDGKSAGEFSAIYFKKELELMRDSTFWLSPTPEKPSTGWDAALPRICTFAEFRHPESDRSFLVFNAHFDHVGDTARFQSMRLILDQIQALNSQGLPLILMGDFNAIPSDRPIQLAKSALKDTRGAAMVVFGPEATFNGFAFDKEPERRLDYLFVNSGFQVHKYAVLTDSYELSYISDHFPVISILSFID